MLQTAYAAGLRVSEVVALQVMDIDSQRMLLHIRCAKGHKERPVPLPALLLEQLRDYWRRYRPQRWLFPGQRPDRPLSIGQVQRIFRQALRAAGIAKKASMHTLRHSYATHLLESGTDRATLQKLLGHNQLSTPLRYTHIQQAHLQQVRSPLDTLPGRVPLPPLPPEMSLCWMSEPSSDDSPTAMPRHALTAEQRRVLADLSSCRTPALGDRLEQCSACGRQEYRYNSCRNRHCPRCQGSRRAAWLEREAGYLLPVEYHHVVFTLPAALAQWARRRPRLVYGLLLSASSAAVLELAADPKYLGAQVGLVSMLHTWGQTLTLHPHVQVLATGGGLSCNRRGAVDDEPSWRWCRPGFFLPVRVLSRLFGGKFLAGLRQALAGEEWAEELSSWLAELYGPEWVVYSQPPAAGAIVTPIRQRPRLAPRLATPGRAQPFRM